MYRVPGNSLIYYFHINIICVDRFQFLRFLVVKFGLVLT